TSPAAPGASADSPCNSRDYLARTRQYRGWEYQKFLTGSYTLMLCDLAPIIIRKIFFAELFASAHPARLRAKSSKKHKFFPVERRAPLPYIARFFWRKHSMLCFCLKATKRC